MIKASLEARSGPWPTPVPVSEAWMRMMLQKHALIPGYLMVRNVAKGAAHALVVFDKYADARAAISCFGGSRHTVGFATAFQGGRVAPLQEDCAQHQAVVVSAIAYEFSADSQTLNTRSSPLPAAAAAPISATLAGVRSRFGVSKLGGNRTQRPRPIVDRRLQRYIWLGDRGIKVPPLKSTLEPPSSNEQFSGWKEELPARLRRQGNACDSDVCIAHAPSAAPDLKVEDSVQVGAAVDSR